MRSLILSLLALLALAGCSAKTSVAITAQPDGSGSIEVGLQLDSEAVTYVPDLENQLRTSDLADAGWTISEVRKEDDGGRSVTAAHGFRSPAQGTALLQQLTGANGSFKNFELRQQRSGLKINSSFTGTVDLTQGLASFGDDVLATKVGSRLGIDPNELLSAQGATAGELFPVSIEVTLPGSSVVRDPVVSDGVWTLAYGEVTNLSATSTGTNNSPLVYGGLGLALFAAAGVTAVMWKKEKYIPRHVRQA